MPTAASASPTRRRSGNTMTPPASSSTARQCVLMAAWYHRVTMNASEHSHEQTVDALGAELTIDGRRVLTGSCSWAERTLVEEAGWYPKRTMSAEERLRFYASKFPL